MMQELGDYMLFTLNAETRPGLYNPFFVFIGADILMNDCRNKKALVVNPEYTH